MTSDLYQRLRSKWVPDRALGELLAKNWIDNAIPALLLALTLATCAALVNGFVSGSSFSSMTRLAGELAFPAFGMTLVMIAGGVDLSIGSVFAISNFAALFLLNLARWPVAAAIPVVLLLGALCGAVNGFLVGYLKLRAFLTTLATLIILRAMADILAFYWGTEVVTGLPESPTWDLLADGNIAGIPINFLAALVAGLGLHVLLTRMRLGWRITAVGGSRRSAYNAGVNVRFTVFLTYVMSGLLASCGGILYAARLNSAGSATGAGLEITILTAAVLGGISLGGGRGSIAKALLGTLIVVVLTSALLRLELPSGFDSVLLGCALLFAVALDVRWLKNKSKLLTSVYVSPGYFALPPAPSMRVGSNSPYQMNDRLASAVPVGLGELDGAEDVAFDAQDNLYTSDRHGNIVRFCAPDYTAKELFVHVGGHPLGIHFDADGNLITCVSGMGLYKVTAEREVVRLSDETNRSLLSIIDDSRLRLADDMDFGPDGKIYFSEATIRYDVTDWATDCIEARGNGRLICYDPATGTTKTVLRNRIFPNGVCMTTDGESLLFAETWAARISRYWFRGPKHGQVEVVIPDLPGYPDNIRRSSDGNFWVALLGVRTPALDLAMEMPDFRKRMTRRVAFEEWIYPNLNTGGIVKFRLDGTVVESMWDSTSQHHPSVTSMREHKGTLWVAGIFNNRIGRLRLPEADPLYVDRLSILGTAT